MHMGGYFDHAIAIASKVLTREENVDHTDERVRPLGAVTGGAGGAGGSVDHFTVADLALVLRADSYKFHNSGYYATQAADDYTSLFGKDPGLREFMGRGREILWIVIWKGFWVEGIYWERIGGGGNCVFFWLCFLGMCFSGT